MAIKTSSQFLAPNLQFSASGGAPADAAAKNYLDNTRAGSAFVKRGIARGEEDRVMLNEEAKLFADELYHDPAVRAALDKTLNADVLPELDITGVDILDLVTANYRGKGPHAQAFDPLVFQQKYHLDDSALEDVHVILSELEELDLIEKKGNTYRLPTTTGRDLEDYYLSRLVLSDVFKGIEAVPQQALVAVEVPKQTLFQKALSLVGLGKKDENKATEASEVKDAAPYDILTVDEKLMQGVEERITAEAAAQPAKQLDVRALVTDEAKKQTLADAFDGLDNLVEVLSLMKEGFPYSHDKSVLPSLCPDYTASKGKYTKVEKQAMVDGLEILVSEGLAKKEFNGTRYWLSPLGEASLGALTQTAKRKKLFAKRQ